MLEDPPQDATPKPQGGALGQLRAAPVSPGGSWASRSGAALSGGESLAQPRVSFGRSVGPVRVVYAHTVTEREKKKVMLQ